MISERIDPPMEVTMNSKAKVQTNNALYMAGFAFGIIIAAVAILTAAF